MSRTKTPMKRLTAEQLRPYCTMPQNRVLMWNGMAVTVRPLLPVGEVSKFVNSVMGACYDQTNDIFIPEMMDFAFRVNTVMRYACVELPADVEEQYTVLYNTGLFSAVMSVINEGQISSIKEAIMVCISRKSSV